MAAEMDQKPAAITIDDDVEWLTEQIRGAQTARSKRPSDRRREVRLQHQMGHRACRAAAPAGALQFARICSTRPMNADFKRCATSCADWPT